MDPAGLGLAGRVIAIPIVKGMSMSADVVCESMPRRERHRRDCGHRRINTDAIRCMVLDGVDNLIRNHVERLIPGSAPPLSFAAFADADQWVLDTMRPIHVVVTTLSLVASTRVVLGNVGHGGYIL
ncbi:hypothetical protein SDC9_202589 [bioreactor metagenome]|uniref:Uncharacterized protein n=1 Tax=bioreactor metagenome TaxID=1076179 RepID=A0A645IU27_9ZZZZ